VLVRKGFSTVARDPALSWGVGPVKGRFVRCDEYPSRYPVRHPGNYVTPHARTGIPDRAARLGGLFVLWSSL